MKEIQNKIKKFCKENKLDTTIEHRTLDLVSEVGEVSKEILKMTNYGKKPAKFTKEIKYELGDVYFSLILLANSLNINLKEALDCVLAKYNRRLKKGSADSEND